MTFMNCILTKASKGLLTKKQSEDINRAYERLLRQYQGTMGDDAAAHMAASEVAKRLSATLIQKNQNRIRTALKVRSLDADLASRVAEKRALLAQHGKTTQALTIGKPSVDQEIRGLYERVQNRAQALRRQSFAQISDFIEKQGSRMLGLVQNTKRMPDVVRAMLGEAVSDTEAAKWGNQLHETTTAAHKRWQAAGGVGGSLERYFPVQHVADRIRAVSFDEWSAKLLPKLDRDKIIDFDTGWPMDDAKLAEHMKGDYESIVSNGLKELQEKAGAGGTMMGRGSDIANRREASRFYHFKDADSFLEYNAEFGVGDNGLFDAVVGHLQTLARDTAIMEQLGPMANSTSRHFELLMASQNVSRVKQGWTKGMYDVLVGRPYLFGGDMPVWYRTLEGSKDIMRSALLGSAPVAAMTDTFFLGMASRLNGVPATKAIGRYLKMLNPLSKVDREAAARSGYVADSLLGSSWQATRFIEDSAGPAKTRWLANFTNRASGLAHMTEQLKNAPVLEAMGMLADFKKTGAKWASLPEELKASFREFDIGEKDFAGWMKAELWSPPDTEGVHFLRPEEIATSAPGSAFALESATKLDSWMQSIRNLASNEPQLRTRSISTGAAFGDSSPGSVNRAFWSTATLFRSFPVSMTFNYFVPAWNKAVGGKMADLAMTATFLTVLGGLSVQTREVLNGRDPLDMGSGHFWQKAALQSGGLGIFGDFMFSDTTRWGNSFAATLAGPFGGLTEDLWRLGKGNIDRVIAGEDTRFLADAVKTASKYVPAQSLWYSKLIVQRLMFDQAEQLLDPRYHERVARMNRKQLQDSGQRNWWARGEAAPERAPDLMAATGK